MLKSLLNSIFNKIAVKSYDFLANRIEQNRQTLSPTQEIQVLLKLKYQKLKNNPPPKLSLPSFSDVGFRQYSQFEEDGILLYIFSMLGTTNKKVVEICAANGKQCMAANLIINHGWQGYLFDGDENNTKTGTEFFKNHPDTFLLPPVFKQAWFAAENVNQILRDAGVTGEIDLLSLDIDGMDYWIWKAIDCIEPRVLVCETQNIIPSDLALTAKYDKDFYYLSQPENEQDYRSVSLKAMAKLCKQKGYRLVGAHKFGFNAFFIKQGLGEEFFPEVTVESCHKDPWSQYGQKVRWPIVKDMDWEQV